MQHPRHGTPDEWLEWLLGPDAARRNEAKLFLGGLQPDDEIQLTPLLRGLESSNHDITFWSIVAVTGLAGRAGSAAGKLRELARGHAEFGIRQAAVAALSKVSPADDQTRMTILKALEDESRFVRREALQALISVPRLESADLLRIAAMAKDSDPNVAHWSEVCLRNIARRPQPAA